MVAGYSLRGSWLRLTGQRPNAGECARYGVPYVEPGGLFDLFKA